MDGLLDRVGGRGVVSLVSGAIVASDDGLPLGQVGGFDVDAVDDFRLSLGGGGVLGVLGGGSWLVDLVIIIVVAYGVLVLGLVLFGGVDFVVSSGGICSGVGGGNGGCAVLNSLMVLTILIVLVVLIVLIGLGVIVLWCSDSIVVIDYHPIVIVTKVMSVIMIVGGVRVVVVPDAGGGFDGVYPIDTDDVVPVRIITISVSIIIIISVIIIISAIISISVDVSISITIATTSITIIAICPYPIDPHIPPTDPLLRGY